MICRDKRVFLDFLKGLSSVPVLFEPFLSHRHAETLIWRRGAHLWEEPREEIATLLSVTERTGSDFVWIDLRGRSPEEKRALRDGILSAKERESAVGFGVLGESSEDVQAGEEAADALGLYGEIRGGRLPVIRMDGTLEDAILRRDCAWFARDRIRALPSTRGSNGSTRSSRDNGGSVPAARSRMRTISA